MIHYEKYTLDNGLTVLIEQDKTTTMAAVNVLYKVGSKNEDPDKTGFAHLFEHLMFGGSDNAPDFDTPLQMAGGENNAFTNNDYTNFYDVVPVQNIETALWLEADRMAHLTLNQEALDVQKKVVVEEFKEVCLNKPYGDTWHHLSALTYQKHHYQWPTIGKEISHIEKAHLGDVADFFQRYYHPQNAILSISSPLSSYEILTIVKKYFEEIPSHSTNYLQSPAEPEQRESRSLTVTGEIPIPMFVLAYHMPGRTHEEYYACDLISDILANGRSARLYNRLVKEIKCVSEIDCYLTGSMDNGLIIIEGKPAENVSIEECIQHVWHEIQLLQTELVDERELQKVKNKAVSSIAMSDLNVLNKAMSMAYFENLGQIEIMNEQEEYYESVTPQDIQAAAKKYLRLENMSQLNYLPAINPS